MKRFILIIALLVIGCKPNNNKRNNYKSKVYNERLTSEKDVGSYYYNNDKIYNVKGVVVGKYQDEYYTDYYLDIKLETGHLIEWEVKRVVYSNKNVDDVVHFDYLSKKRLNSKP